MAKESFFSRLRDSFFGKDEVELNESIETKENKLPEAEVKNPSLLEVTPKVIEGAAEVAASFFLESPVNRRQDNELKPLRDPFRLEHEPYRYDENGDGILMITPANLYEIHPASGGVILHPLKTTTLGDEEALPRNCVVCSTFSTDEHGAVTDDGYDIYVHEGGSSKELADPPASTQFILPDEDGNGYGGTYYMPLFWIQDGKLERNTWEGPNRSAKLMGGVHGHRGPMWWVKGYNVLKNIGGAKNIYREYVRADDDKLLRTITGVETGLSSPYCGDERVRVRYNGEDDVEEGEEFDKSTADTIEILGNGVHRIWTIGGHKVAIVEDGLVNGIEPLDCKDLTVREADSIGVVKFPESESDYTDVLTSTTETSISTVAVSGLPDDDTGYRAVVDGVTYGDVAGLPAAEDKVSVLKSDSSQSVVVPTLTADNTVSVWHSGTTGDAVKTLLATAVAGVPDEDTDYVSVVESATYGYVASDTAGTTANVLTTQDASVEVASASLTVGDYTSVLTSGGTTSCAGIPTASDKISVATSNSTDDAVVATSTGNFVTGTNPLSYATADITVSGVTYTVLTVTSSGYGTLAHASSTAAAITGVTYGTFVNDITYEQTALGSVPEVTNVVTSTGTTSAVTSIPSTTIGTTTVVATLAQATAVTSVSHTDVLQDVGTAVNAYTSVSETISVVDATTIGSTAVVKSLPFTTVGVTSVVETLPTVSAVTSDTVTTVISQLPSVNVLAGTTDSSSISFVTAAGTTSVLTNYQNANVWEYAENDSYIEGPSGMDDGDEVSLVECPTQDLITGCQDGLPADQP